MDSTKDDGGRGLMSQLTSFSLKKSGSSSGSNLQRQATSLRRRSAVSAEVTTQQEADAFHPKVIPKNDDASKRIQQALEKNYLFKALDKEQTRTVIDAVEEVKYKAGDVIIKQGDSGDRFYLLEEGTCEVWLQRPDKSEKEMVKEYSAGDSFGELALLYNAPRAATIKASSNCTLWAMDRMTFQTILMHTTSKKRKLYESFLEDVPLLKTLDQYERAAISDVLEPEYFEAGQDIVVEGQPGDTFYFLEEGEAEARTRGKMLMKYKRGDFFGELALLNDKPRAATVIAVTQCKCASINRASFKRLLGKLDDILHRKKDEYGQACDAASSNT